MTSILIKDETLARHHHTWSLEFLDETISAREFLRRRIYEEVQNHNTKPVETYNGLIQPALEQTLNGTQAKLPRQLNWETQYQTALEAFASNGFIMLWNDQQIEDLEQMLELREGSQVTFLKLTPLVGG